jgi:hypothetical protein
MEKQIKLSKMEKHTMEQCLLTIASIFFTKIDEGVESPTYENSIEQMLGKEVLKVFKFSLSAKKPDTESCP